MGSTSAGSSGSTTSALKTLSPDSGLDGHEVVGLPAGVRGVLRRHRRRGVADAIRDDSGDEPIGRPRDNARGLRGWWVHGRRRRSLDGCVDVDVAATPLTNTLPIRRLGLRVGEEALIRAAWVDVPSLRVSPEEQGYRRVGAIEGSPGLEAWDFWPVGGRTYRLTVDPDGLVVDYQDLAERVG